MTHDRDGSVVQLDDGRALPAGAVVDASGHRPALARPGSGRAPAWQVAYGILGRFSPAPVAAGTACFMDWRTPGAAQVGGPTFCYALDVGDGLTLVEETTLAARPGGHPDALRGRLAQRLATDGIRVSEQVGVERVRFPMGVAVPPRDQRVVAFGAAAGMVHPATGYQVARALSTAPRLAAALGGALTARDASPGAVAAAGWRAVWPPGRLRERALHVFGLELLLGFDAAGLQRFFEVFFTLPTARWSAYVSGAPASEVARVMGMVARRLPVRERAQVLAHALGPHGARLVRDLAVAGGGRRGRARLQGRAGAR